jgi:hypothetical protein
MSRRGFCPPCLQGQGHGPQPSRVRVRPDFWSVGLVRQEVRANPPDVGPAVVGTVRSVHGMGDSPKLKRDEFCRAQHRPSPSSYWHGEVAKSTLSLLFLMQRGGLPHLVVLLLSTWWGGSLCQHFDRDSDWTISSVDADTYYVILVLMSHGERGEPFRLKIFYLLCAIFNTPLPPSLGMC